MTLFTFCFHSSAWYEVCLWKGKEKKREKNNLNKNFTPANYEFINSDNKDSGDLASVIHISQYLAGQK